MLCRRTGLSQGSLAQQIEGCPRSWSLGYCCTVGVLAPARKEASSGSAASAGPEDLQTPGGQQVPCRAYTLSLRMSGWQGTSNNCWLGLPSSKGWHALCQARELCRACPSESGS